MISGSPDGTAPFVVDNALDVDFNGVQFYSDCSSSRSNISASARLFAASEAGSYSTDLSLNLRMNFGRGDKWLGGERAQK